MSTKLKTLSFYLTFFLFVFMISFLSNSVDLDFFARLLQGQAFFDLGHILKSDIFSYTQTHTWYDHEWGASVIFYWVLKHFNQMGIFILKSILISLTFFFAIQTLKLQKVESTKYHILFFIITFFASFTSAFDHIIRCMLFSYLFFTIYFYILERVRIKNENYLLTLLPIIMIFWQNIHGGCMAGFGLICIYCLGEFLNKKPYLKYLYTILAIIPLSLVNPWGWEYVKFLLQATTMPRPLIAEWQGTFADVNDSNFFWFKIYFCVMMLFIVIEAIQKKFTLKKLNWTKVLMICTMAFLAIKYTRHQIFFVITTIVFLYNDLYENLDKITDKIFFSSTVKTLLTAFKEGIIYGLIIFISLDCFFCEKPEITITNEKFPIYAIEFIKINDLKGNLLINFDYGSYAAYKLYPNNKIAIDGRYEEVYPDYLLPMFNNFFLQVGEKRTALIEYFPPDIALIENKYKANELFKNHQNYQKIYSDEIYSIYVRHKLTKRKYLLPTKDEKYYVKNLFKNNIDFKELIK